MPDPIAELLAIAYPGATISDVAATYGGFSNTTLMLHIDGMPYIVKASNRPEKRSDLRREARILQLLAASRLPIAPLIALLEGAGWTAELLGSLPGQNGIQYLLGAVGSSHAANPVPLFGKLGRLLREVHRIVPPINDSDLDLCARAHAAASILPRMLAECNLPNEQLAALQRGLARAAIPPGRMCFIHGDPGAHNLLWDGKITGLLDWEWACCGDSLADLSWVCWTIRFRALPDAARVAFLAGYGVPSPDPTLLHEFALAHIAMILARVAHLPAPRDEWLRRLAWTIGS